MSDFFSNFYKISHGEGVQGPYSLMQNFTVVALKNVGLQASKSPKFVIFGINLPQSPYAIFTIKV